MRPPFKDLTHEEYARVFRQVRRCVEAYGEGYNEGLEKSARIIYLMSRDPSKPTNYRNIVNKLRSLKRKIK